MQLYRTIINFLLQATILFIFFSATWWWRPRWYVMGWHPLHRVMRDMLDSSNSTDIYYARFALTSFILLLVVFWVLSGLKGSGQLIRSWQGVWLLCLLGLVGLAVLSVGWAAPNNAVARSQAMQWVLTWIFVVIVSAVKPATRHVIWALTLGMLVQGMLGIAQVAAQHEIGISTYTLRYGIGLAEFDLDPMVSGTSVIQSNGIRFLRAYGLTPHPNLLGAGLVAGILSSLALWNSKLSWMAGVSAIGLWALLLSFSRASIGGFAVGLMVILVAWWLSGQRRDVRFYGRIGLMLLLVGSLFYGLYHDLVNVRAGVGDEGSSLTVETRSLSDRRVFTEQAFDIIEAYPIRGIGIGNFPWESSARLRADSPEMDLQGQNVHNAYLLMLAELGISGGLLFLFTIVVAILLVIKQYRCQILSVDQIAILGSVIAWLGIGWFEFFWWSLLTHQLLFWGMMAVGVSEDKPYGNDQAS